VPGVDVISALTEGGDGDGGGFGGCGLGRTAREHELAADRSDGAMTGVLVGGGGQVGLAGQVGDPDVQDAGEQQELAHAVEAAPALLERADGTDGEAGLAGEAVLAPAAPVAGARQPSAVVVTCHRHWGLPPIRTDTLVPWCHPLRAGQLLYQGVPIGKG
jgi:hypothetical protein